MNGRRLKRWRKYRRTRRRGSIGGLEGRKCEEEMDKEVEEENVEGKEDNTKRR
jgi:hypothetical protein